MTYTEIHNAIRSRFKTQIEDGQSLPTLYDNDGQAAPTDNSMWCRLLIYDGANDRITVGVETYRRHGVAIAELYGPPGSGDADLLTLAEAIVSAFSGVSAGGVRYPAARIECPGQNGAPYQMNVICRFHADHQV